jgi:hypothetical protein
MDLHTHGSDRGVLVFFPSMEGLIVASHVSPRRFLFCVPISIKSDAAPQDKRQAHADALVKFLIDADLVREIIGN